MILSDKSILSHLRNGKIGVSPSPSHSQIQPASLDVRLGKDVYHESVNIEQNIANQNESLIIDPFSFVLTHTNEEISLPNDIGAILAGRSTIARKGVAVHATAGWLDPGFSGQVVLEMFNFSSEPVTFNFNDPIAQLIFLQLDQPSTGYDGQYQNQQGVEKSGDIFGGSYDDADEVSNTVGAKPPNQ